MRLRVTPARPRHPSFPPSFPPGFPPSLPPRACCLSLSPSSPRAGSLLPGTARLGKEPDSSRPGPADAGGSSLTPSPCGRGSRAALLQTQHLSPGWQGVPGKTDRLPLPCPTSWIGLCQCI